MASAGTSNYTINNIAKAAVEQLGNSLRDRRGNRMAVNDLDSYVTDLLRADYAPYTDYDSILNRYNLQSDAAWELARQEQIQAMNNAEAQNYANTRNAVNEMRNAMAGSAASGANRGAANASALQAMLGLGQQNSQTTTEGMQGYQNAAREAAESRAANAVTALEFAKGGTDSMYNNATSAYNSDHLYGNQGIAESYGNIATSVDQSASQERMNNATNKTNLAVEQTTKKTESKNTNINKK